MNLDSLCGLRVSSSSALGELFSFVLMPHLKIIFLYFSKKVHDYEQVIVTPHVNVDLTQTQLNEDNEDFSSRRRYHQTGTVQGQLIDI